MKTKYILGGTLLTVLLVLGVSLFWQIKKALKVMTLALSKASIDAYIA